MILEFFMSLKNACVKCLDSNLELCTFPKMMHLMTITTLPNLFTKFCFQMPTNWDGLFNVGRFRTIGKNLPKSSQNTIFMPCTIVSVANVLTHGVQVKDEPDGVSLDHQPAFIDLCNSFDENTTVPISIHPSNSLLLNSIASDALG